MLVNSENFKEKFERIINKYNEFIILPHYNPDPDAIASSYALNFLLNKVFNKKSTIYSSGIIGRASNKKMIQVLDIGFENLKDSNQIPDIPVILMDTQPGTGNNPLKSKKNLKIIIDHHPYDIKSKTLEYVDVRNNYGSCSTIIFNYFKEFNLKPTVNVATALYYGIQSDCIGEGRTAFKIDFQYMEELEKYINHEKLYSIENPKLPFDYYINISKGMENSVIYNDFLITTLGKIENPDYIGEIADFLIRFDKCYLALVMGENNGTLLLSFRSQKKKINAGSVIKSIIGRDGSGGGHSSSAGGRIYIHNSKDIPLINKKIITKALKIIHGKITSGVPLLSLSDYMNY